MERMDGAEVQIEFEPDVSNNLIWLVVDGERVCALPPEPLKKLAQAAIDCANKMYLPRALYETLLDVVHKREVQNAIDEVKRIVEHGQDKTSWDIQGELPPGAHFEQ